LCVNFDSNTLMYKQYTLVAALFLAGGLLSPNTAFGQGKVTFNRDIAPLVFSRCAQCHHPEGSAPFSLLTYQAARQHATQMAVVTKNRLMPPWNAESSYGPFVGLHPLRDDEIDLIRQWVQAGAPEGRSKDLPAAPHWAAGWQLGQPDLVVTFPEAYTLPADGPDISRVFVLPLPVDRVRFVQGVEFRPGNPRVHHANIRIDATPASRRLDEQDPAPGYDGIILRSAVYPDGHFLGWTPGQAAPLLPKGLAWRLAPNSDLVVQMHMVPSGRPEAIQPSIGLYFTDDPPERTPVMLRLSNQTIDIPAGEKSYTVTDTYTLPVDVEVQAVQPHAHYLLHEVTGTATLPDGTSKTLIYIKDWDLRWQHVYRYETPFALPKGSTVSMRYTYDNSAGNPRSPTQPPAHVVWGQQSKEEMGDLWIQVLTKSPQERETLDVAFHAKWMATDIVGYEQLLKRNPANAALQDDCAVLYLELNRPAEAVPHFEASMKLNPASAAAHFNYGTTLMAVGRLDDAIGQFQRALQLRPEYALAHNNLGIAVLRLGHVDEALGHFRDAARVDPSNREPHANLASVLRSRRDFKEAIVEYREAVRLSPDRVTTLAGLASLLATAPDATLRNPADAVRLAARPISRRGAMPPRSMCLRRPTQPREISSAPLPSLTKRWRWRHRSKSPPASGRELICTGRANRMSRDKKRPLMASYARDKE
jgi:Flp pilus assembly protein TadD/mono/diheme cytochrome c family protein